jgi:hypothetical protein
MIHVRRNVDNVKCLFILDIGTLRLEVINKYFKYRK